MYLVKVKGFKNNKEYENFEDAVEYAKMVMLIKLGDGKDVSISIEDLDRVRRLPIFFPNFNLQVSV